MYFAKRSTEVFFIATCANHTTVRNSFSSYLDRPQQVGSITVFGLDLLGLLLTSPRLLTSARFNKRAPSIVIPLLLNKHLPPAITLVGSERTSYNDQRQRQSAPPFLVRPTPNNLATMPNTSNSPYPQPIPNAYPHQLLRLTPDHCSSLYFNYSAYTPDGEYMVIITPEGISKLKVGTWETTPVASMSGEWKLLFTGRKTRRVWYEVEKKEIWTVDIDTGSQVKICDIPAGAEVQGLNCDETLLALVRVDPAIEHPMLTFFRTRDKKTDQFDYRANWPDGTPMSYADAKEVKLADRLRAEIPMEIITLNTETAETKSVLKSTDWLNHLMFSPTNPNIMMYCHEGPWHLVDRLWYLDLSTAADPVPVKVHARTMNMEIVGHEWFSADGETIWYDLQTPRGQSFWVAGYHIPTAERKWYHVERNDWSVHYHANGDNTLFCGDGADEEMVASAPDGKYLYLFQPKSTPDVAGLKATDSKDLIQSGYMLPEKIVDLKGNDYKLEPNANFTPDGKWVVFRSNMTGEMATYAVKVDRDGE